jgi:hypothetical protein
MTWIAASECRDMFAIPALALCMIAAELLHPLLAHAEAPSPCHLVKLADLPVTVTSRNAVLVAGGIKEEPAKFLVDTGAAQTTFDGTVFTRFGVSRFGRELRVMGVGGETTAVRTKIPDLKVGDFDGGSLLLTVASTHFLPDGIYGLLGEDFFGQFDMDIDLAKGNIGLFEHNACPTEPVYWSKSFSEAEISARPMRVLVSIMVDGVPASAVLDSGAARTVISTALFGRLGLSPESPGVERAGVGRGIDGHELTSYRYRFGELRIGDEAIKNPVLIVSNLAPVKFNSASVNRLADSNALDGDALLGADFLKSHHVYIAPKEGKMYFTYNGGGIFSPPTEETPPR